MLLILNRYFRNQDGMTALEFGLAIGPFLWMVLGIIELSLAFASGTNLEGATLNASRLIKTGQAQSPTPGLTSEQMFVDRLCDQTILLIKCDDIKYQVVALGDNTGFGNADNITVEFDENGDLLDANGNPGNSFDAGGISDVILVRVIYHYEFITPLMSSVFANNDLGKMTFMSTIVMKNEPYDFEV